MKELNYCAVIFQFLGHLFFSVKNFSFRNQNRWPHFISCFYHLPCSCLLWLGKTDVNVPQLSAKTFLNRIVVDATFGDWVLLTFVILIQSYSAIPFIGQEIYFKWFGNRRKVSK